MNKSDRWYETIEQEEKRCPMTVEDKFVAAFFGLVLACGVSVTAMVVFGMPY